MRLKHPVDFLRRLGFFLFGLGIGIYFLNKFLDKKNASFDYLPNARTLKSIRSKPYFVYSPKAKLYMEQNKIDTTAVQNLLQYGNVNFNKNNRGKAPCHTYLIEPTKKTASMSILVERCDSVATVIKLVKY